MKLPNEFRTLSREIGVNPQLVQGPGGNTSIKQEGVMWIKASGTLLADALDKDIFVAVDPVRAMRELDGAGDGSCRSALIDAKRKLRPSIETTFHAMFPQKFVFHFHSVATICHVISPQGRSQLANKLQGLSWVCVPYQKPGIPLTKAIRAAVGENDAQVVVLKNHGVIVLGESIEEVKGLIDRVERRLELKPCETVTRNKPAKEIDGWERLEHLSALAIDSSMHNRATSGTYYPDHAVFLGPGLPSLSVEELAQLDTDQFPVPVVLVPDEAVYIKSDATAAHRAMIDCLYDVLVRIPPDWDLVPIGQDAEAELLNWDAEKYRQMLSDNGGCP